MRKQKGKSGRFCLTPICVDFLCLNDHFIHKFIIFEYYLVRQPHNQKIWVNIPTSYVIDQKFDRTTKYNKSTNLINLPATAGDVDKPTLINRAEAESALM